MSPAAATPAILDPRVHELRRAVRLWLRVQQAFALRPVEAAARLAEDPDPEHLLRDVPPGRDPEAARRSLVRAGGRLVPLPSSAYPARLRRLADAAPVLGVRGDPRTLGRACVALVGARAATAYGREMAARLASGLAASGVVVVSGLARGIDAVAHESALAAGGESIAIQACGLDRVYPAHHRALAARIASQGAIVSELPPGMPPRPAHFPLRNRLISGLSRAVVVVEARVRSGSLVTARHGLDQGIEVLAVPGPVTAATSEGTNQLLREGAAPALDVEDVLRAAGLPVAAEGACSAPSAAGEAARPAPSAAGEAARPAPRAPADVPLVEALRDAPCTRDALLRRLGWDAGRLAAALLELELAGRVVEDRDGRLCLVGEGW